MILRLKYFSIHPLAKKESKGLEVEKVLADGGEHSGEVNFPVSFALTHNQTAAANIARLDVEYTDKIKVARELNKTFETKGFIPDMMEKYGYKDPNDFLNALDNLDFKLPHKTRDIYFYFPYRMADIYPTVAIFSSIDLKTGKVHQSFIVATRVVGAGKEGLKFANGLWMGMKGNMHPTLRTNFFIFQTPNLWCFFENLFQQ
ncbi:hypothetical protein [Caminibacter sp.]